MTAEAASGIPASYGRGRGYSVRAVIHAQRLGATGTLAGHTHRNLSYYRPHPYTMETQGELPPSLARRLDLAARRRDTAARPVHLFQEAQDMLRELLGTLQVDHVGDPFEDVRTGAGDTLHQRLAPG